MKVYISYYPICSTNCKQTCESCKIDTLGRLTGRDWMNEKSGEKLVEVEYNRNGEIEYDVVPNKYIKNVDQNP